MDPLAYSLTAPSVEWSEVERGNVRAQALAELRALSWHHEKDRAGGSDPQRTIVLP